MTDLMSRRASLSSRVTGRRPRDDGAQQQRPVTVSAALGAGAAAGGSLLVCLALAVIGWFFSDAGAHGQTTEALHVGAVVWLFGHGATLHWGSSTIGMVPLGLAGLFALSCFRTGRWAGRTSAAAENDRVLGMAVAIFTGVYLTIGVLTAVLTSQGDLSVDIGGATLATLLVPGVFGALGLAVGTERLPVWLTRVPGWIRSVTEAAVVAALSLVALSALLVAGMVLLHFNEAARAVSSLRMGTGDTAMFALLNAAFAPNAALFGTSWLLGPGFAVGAGTVVSPGAVTLGPVPALPLLAGLPAAGPVPGWMLAVLAVPVLSAAVSAGMAQHRYGVTAWDSAALRGFGSGFAAGLLLTVLVALAGGPLGTGRLADFGPSVGAVFVAASSAMALGGLVGGLLVTVRQRRQQRR